MKKYSKINQSRDMCELSSVLTAESLYHLLSLLLTQYKIQIAFSSAPCLYRESRVTSPSMASLQQLFNLTFSNPASVFPRSQWAQLVFTVFTSLHFTCLEYSHSDWSSLAVKYTYPVSLKKKR